MLEIPKVLKFGIWHFLLCIDFEYSLKMFKECNLKNEIAVLNFQIGKDDKS